MKLFTKIFLFMLTAFAVVVLSISYLVAKDQVSCAKQNIIRKHTLIGTFLSKQVEVGYFESHWPFESLKKLSECKGFLFWWIVRDDGIIHLADKASFIRTAANDYFPEIALMQEQVTSVNPDENYAVFFRPFGTGKGKWSFWYGFSLDEVSERESEIFSLVASMSVSALLAVGLALFFGIRHFTKPIKTLSLGASIIGEGDLGHRVRVDSRDEIGGLAQSFNQMADNLLQSYTALRESEEKYRLLAQHSADVIYKLNMGDERFAYVSPSAERALGYTSEELLALRVGDMLTAESYEKQRKKMIEAIARGERSSEILELEAVHKDGHTIPVEIHASIVWDEQGTPVQIQGVARDITERRRAQEALRESEERYRSVVEQASEGIYLIDLDTKRILEANEAFQKMLGYSGEEISTLLVYDLVAHEREDIDSHIQRVVAERYLYIGERQYRRSDGNTVDVEASASVISFGRKKVLCVVARDITEKKRMQTRLAQAQKMEAIATLAGGIAHKFNNALSVIAASIDMLSIEAAGNENIRGYAEWMKESTDRMVRLTSQLLAYARGGKYRAEVTSLNDFVINTLRLVMPTLGSSVRVETNLAPGIFAVKADLTQMQMVLSAVMENASEAIEGEGQIRISTRNEEVDENLAEKHPGLKPGSYACLTVEDNGRGMDEQTRRRVFEPFFTTKFQGRGLGLAAAYGIVKNHGGWISVESELGRGTTVRIYLLTIPEVE